MGHLFMKKTDNSNKSNKIKSGKNQWGKKKRN